MAWHDARIEKGPVPIWFQISNILRSSISAGEFKEGDKLPSEGDLNSVFGVSRTTARAALNKLENEGLIFRQSGRGSIVVTAKVDQPLNVLSGFADDMRRRGIEPGYKTLLFGFSEPDEEVVRALELHGDRRAFRTCRLLLADGRPIGVTTSWIPAAVMGEVAPPDLNYLNSNSLYLWLAEQCGVLLSGGREYIEAACADVETAELLEMSVGDPTLVARRLVRDQRSLPAEYAVNHYRADRYRYWIDLEMG
ncbi:GntR family transcriptional regulator [Pelagibacterium sp. H642]|uniref:GntR family transcriptional regulator n=1 Tax=Pelagibacterium sp. H642 TaxID=1881069 RepID=UPI0028156B41|nr:GntR family transcriptional regulator [Pelagibacterium sp. H642]WMT90416.1 GntR family transcriptional regulator [Pelagibacterium sp. H642]